MERVPQFDALCRVGDELRVRWKLDGGILLCRSTRYIWNKLREVPNRLLDRWFAGRREHGVLPLNNLLEMATLTDQQLDSMKMGQVVQHCLGLEEWSILGNGRFRYGTHYSVVRPFARFMGLLHPPQRAAAQARGLALAELTPTQQEQLARLWLQRGFTPQELASLHIRCDYVPAGYFTWHPVANGDAAFNAARRWPVVSGKTMETVLDAARRFDPGAAQGQIKRSSGELAVTIQSEGGRFFRMGGPTVGFR